MSKFTKLSLILVIAAAPFEADAGIQTVRSNWKNVNADVATQYEAPKVQTSGDPYLQYSAPYAYQEGNHIKKVRTRSYSHVELNFPEHRDTNGEKVFIFDPKQGGWAAYNESGNLVKTGVASGGSSWCKDLGRSCHTAVGTFKVYRMGGANCKSSKFPMPYGGAPMPHCMFFHNGLAVHGSYDVPNYNASHGCVRVNPEAAQWLHSDFMRVGTKVIVKPYSL